MINKENIRICNGRKIEPFVVWYTSSRSSGYECFVIKHYI